MALQLHLHTVRSVTGGMCCVANGVGRQLVLLMKLQQADLV